MDTINESSTDEALEAGRVILRKALDEIVASVRTALRDVGLSYPVYVRVPHSGNALATIITSADPPNDDWGKVATIFLEVIGDRLGGIGLLAGELPCAAVVVAMNGADLTADV